MLLILAAAVGYLSIKYLAAILPADSYKGKGVYTFCILFIILYGIMQRLMEIITSSYQ